METLLKDLRYGARALAKRPTFTLVAVLSLGLGIGANATIFSCINAVLLRPLPVKEASTLLSVYAQDSTNGGLFPFSYPNYIDYRNNNQVFTQLAAYRAVPISLNSGEGLPERIVGELVSANYFETLGVSAFRGHLFEPGKDETPGASPEVVLSHQLWQRRFGGDLNILGKPIQLNGRPFSVAGIAPPGFGGLNMLRAPELWVPMNMHQQILTGELSIVFDKRRTKIFSLVGRLKPGVGAEQAESALQSISKRLEEQYPLANQGLAATVAPLVQNRLGPDTAKTYFRAAELLMVVVGLVLLIACANVANLLLARASSRRKEIAIRLAIGTGRGRLIRQLLTESILLAVLGGLAGLLFAYWAARALWTFRPPFLPDSVDLSLDTRVLVFTFLLSLLTGLIFGLIPALQATRPELVPALKDQTQPVNAGPGRLRLHGIFVVAQTALALVSLIGAGLFLRSLQRAQEIDPGFDSQRLLVMSFDVGILNYDRPQAEGFVRRMIEQVEAIPGVESATVANHLRLASGGSISSVVIDGETPESGVDVRTNTVGLNYFETLGIPIIEGRDFNPSDVEPSPLGWAIVNEAMVEKFWHGRSPVGQRFSIFNLPGQPFEVVGVAKDGKYDSLGESSRPYMYFLFGQVPDWALTLHVRTSGDPQTMLASIRNTVQALDPALPLTNVKTMDQVIADALWAPRMAASLLAIFGLLALALAIIGIYGVSAYTVSQRRQEIGIRMALGAQRGDVLGLILRQNMVSVVVGLVLGLLAAFTLSRLIASFLFGVSAADPVAFGLTSLLLAGIAFLATLLSARRAATVDPLLALRAQ
jgi:predicted permease